MADQLRYRYHWVFCIAAAAVWIAWGWPVFEAFAGTRTIRDTFVSPLWFVPYTVFGLSILIVMVATLRPGVLWTLLGLQVAAVVVMAIIIPWAGMSTFLVITAWQVGMATSPAKAMTWIVLQTLAIVAALAQALNPDLCWVITESFALQLVLFLTATALRREAETSRALVQAQALIANTVRDAERLRISRELHDAWGHELTALGLQLEIASHTEPGRANDHVSQAKDMARNLMAKVRDVVSTLREAERCDLEESLGALARSVPKPRIHVEVGPDVRASPEQAHALLRCAQEAVTNAVKHAHASNLWLQVTSDHEGVRLIARNDGSARPTATKPGSGLVGMRERLESLGGKLAVRSEGGFTIDAWLPSVASQPA